MLRTVKKAIYGNGKPRKRTVRRLRKLTRKHPYSQPLQMALAGALKAAGEEGYEQEARKAEACAPDRRIFRAFLSGEWKPGEQPVWQQGGAEKPREKEEVLPNGDGKPGKRTRRQQEIIDRFLAQPQTMRRKAGEVPEGELARESIEDHPDLVGETLADILAKQGKKDKAAAIYEKLRLTFPEKSSYFAKKIASLQ